MTEAEKVLTDWVNYVCSDYYIMWSEAFKDEGGFKIVEHTAPAISHGFFRLLCNLLPGMDSEAIPYSRNDDALTFFPGGVQVTIEPFDDKIHHTQFVKEN